MNIPIMFVFIAVLGLGAISRACCADTPPPSVRKPVHAQDYLLLAEKYVKEGSSKNEMSRYQSAENVLGGANFELARRYFLSAAQELEREIGYQILSQQQLQVRQQAARIYGEQGWFLYKISAGPDKAGAAKLVSQAVMLDPANATLQFKMAAIEIDRYEDGGEKDKNLLRDVKEHLHRAIQLGPDEASPSFWMMATLTAGEADQTSRIGELYVEFLQHAQGLNPEIYLYDIRTIEERSRSAQHFAQLFAPSLLRRLGPQILPHVLAGINVSIARRGWSASGSEPEPTVPSSNSAER